MHCTNCGKLLDSDARFCSACGQAANAAIGSSVPPVHHRLVRPRSQKKIAGVCAAFANSLNIDVTIVRLVWFVLVFGAGTGLIAYIVAWIVIPASD